MRLYFLLRSEGFRGTIHSFRYEGKYVGTSEGQVTLSKEAQTKVLAGRKEPVMV